MADNVLEGFLKETQKNLEKRFKTSESRFEIAKDIKPATGLVIDNPQLEYILDRRFLAYGRAYLVYGKKGNAKTSLFFDLAKMVQKAGGYAFWFESERADDRDYMRKQGVDPDRTVIIHPDSLEQALTSIISTIQSLDKLDPTGQTPVLICLDSIAGCVPEFEQESNMVIGDTQPGIHARRCSQFYRVIENVLAPERCIFVALNQQKSKIGGMSIPGQDNEALIGGESQFFHSTYHWKLSRIKELYAIDEYGAERKVGSRHEIIGKRNKLGREGNKQRVEFDLYIDGGVDWYSPLVRKLGDDYPVLVKHTRGYSWQIPDCAYDLGTDKGIIPVDDNLGESELARMISGSPQAKDKIREVFGIPELPTEEEAVKVDEDRKEKRKYRKKIAAEVILEKGSSAFDEEDKKL